MKTGPIILIEDDEDDHEVFVEALNELGVENPVIWFTTCPDCLQYLRTTTDKPFLIFCDMNLPVMSGMEFKRTIDHEPQLRRKSIPFLFYSTTADQQSVDESYLQMTVQGFFQKKSDFDEIKTCLNNIINYWLDCKHPNLI